MVLAPARVPYMVEAVTVFDPLTAPYKGPTRVVPEIVVPEMVLAPFTDP
jgi:hypothetical protein